MHNRSLNYFIVFLVIVTIASIYIGNRHFENKTNNKVIQTTEVSTKENLEVNPNKIFVYSLNEQATIYIKGTKSESNAYIGYTLGHFTKELNQEIQASNYDVWNIKNAHEYARTNENNFKLTKEVVRAGEWEMAIREVDTNDFIGGTAHGDEITTSVQMFIDGSEINSNEFIDREVDEFKVITTSDLYRDNTTTQNPEIVGSHTKVYTFTSEGLVIEQEVEFTDSMKVEMGYLAMLPILRDRNGKQVTDSYSVNDEETKHDVSSTDFEITGTQASKATIAGKESGIKATVEILEKGSEIPTTFFVSNSPEYNKLYFVYAQGGYSVKSGDVWTQKTKYDIDTTN